MRILVRSVLCIGLLVLCAAHPVWATLAEISLLEADLVEVRKQIATAKDDAQAYTGGFVHALILQRLQTLQLTEALLDQRRIALREGAAFTYQVPATKPDLDRHAEIMQDLLSAQTELAKAKAEAARYSGGLVHTLALSALMMQKQTVAMLTHAALATRYGLPTPTFEQGVSALEKGISRKITPRSEPAGQSQTVRVKDCLEVADFGSRLLDYNRVFAKVAWKVDIANSCDLAFAVRVRFALQDAEEYEVDHDTKDIRIPPNGIGKARGDMLVSPSEGYKRVEFNGVSFTLLQ